MRSLGPSGTNGNLLWSALLLAMGMSVTAPGLAMAQDRDHPAEDAKVRVQSDVFRGEARLVGWTADSLHLEQEAEGHPITIPRHAVASLETGSPRTPTQGLFRRAGQGFLVGAALGGGVSYLGCRTNESPSDKGDPPACALFGGLLYGLRGAWVGGIVGAIHPGTRWESMQLSGTEVSLGQGEALLSIRF